MALVTPFTEEQARALINLDQRYEVWIESERTLASLAYGMQKKTIDGRDYLYAISDRKGNGRSLGPWDDDKEKLLEDYKQQKAIAKDRSAQSKAKLDESATLVRALRLPLLASETGPILREADKRSLLGNSLLVVGTNAMAAYSVEAGGTIRDLPTETEDFDLAWTRMQQQDQEQTIWNMLKAVDPTFTVNTERTFQARNAKAYEVEILVAPSRAGGMARTDRPWPVPLPEQEWLLNGKPVDRVVACRDGSPARIIAPDPRWFAIQKLWMSGQKKRNNLKRPKDLAQGMLLLDAVAEAMPHYPLNAEFEASLPGELAPYFAAWLARRPDPLPPLW